MKRWVYAVLIAQFIIPCLLSGADIDQVEKLIGQLGADRFALRKEAQKKIIEKGLEEESILKKCLDELHKTKDPEIKDRLDKILFQLAKHWVLLKPKAFLGIQFSQGSLEAEEKGQFGFKVLSVIAGSAAKKSGLEAADLIVEIGKLKIDDKTTSEQFVSEISRRKVGDELSLKILRGKESISFKFELGEIPKEFRPPQSKTPEAMYKEWLIEQSKKYQ